MPRTANSQSQACEIFAKTPRGNSFPHQSLLVNGRSSQKNRFLSVPQVFPKTTILVGIIMLIATLNIELMKLFGVTLMFWVIMVTATASTAARQQLKVPTRLRHHSSRSMPSMKREELVQAIRAMGEEPPRQWSKTELQVRLTELEEEHGVTRVKGRQHTNLQLWMVRLNEAKKLKSTLVTFVENELGLSVQPNQTIARLTQEAVEKIYHISKPSASDPMGFGCHANKTYEEVIQTEPSYVKWARNTVAEGPTCARLGRFVTWLEMSENPSTTKMDTYTSVPQPRAKAKSQVSPRSVVTHSSSSTAMMAQTQAMFETVMNAVGSLKEEIDHLKEERPHKKSDTHTEKSFSMIEGDN